MKTNYAFVAVETISLLNGRMYSDQTEKFPITSLNKNKYIFVLHNYDSNAILVQPLLSSESHYIAEAYKQVIK